MEVKQVLKELKLKSPAPLAARLRYLQTKQAQQS